jgi:tRNA U34 5-methylaminomethyl-2-thiouridine-forming methyltransferase MnmC
MMEARERYAAACRLAERARHRSELRLLDVGCGLGLNLAAALEAVGRAECVLECVSLEIDTDVLHAALELARAQGAWCSSHEAVLRALRTALADPARAATPGGIPMGERARLRLVLGDARQTLAALEPAERFDAVFLDPFSPAKDPALWEPAFLSEVAARMRPESWLSTYSSAFRVRLALARAGLRVGRGARVGAKASGTLASPDCEPPALEPRTARRLAARAGVFRADGGFVRAD